MKKASWDALLEAAAGARSHAHAPYSRYKVGAALLTREGHVFAGCNVENATYGATICAERAAVTAMVAAGDREPVACVVVTRGPSPGAPCGICRQVLSEFADDMPILLAAVDPKGTVVATERASLRALLPKAFHLR
jgi:cytidine deaminase